MARPVCISAPSAPRHSGRMFGDTPMIKKVLIADHGDVAIRLLMEFKRAGVKTVTVYTQEDCNSEHVQIADESICIGKTLKSYHNDWHRVISAAEISEVDAVHPGEGPLSTHERFAEVCAEIGLQFLGRNAEQGGST
jgi:acetyl-CoA carboxylase biotin carboxylase subunit